MPNKVEKSQKQKEQLQSYTSDQWIDNYRYYLEDEELDKERERKEALDKKDKK